MKYKLIIDTSLLKPALHSTISKSLLVLPSELVNQLKSLTVVDLLKYAYENLKFALRPNVLEVNLYLTTEDDFVLPPNAELS